MLLWKYIVLGWDFYMKLGEIEEKKRILLHIRNDDYEMDLGATLERHVNDSLAIISLEYSGSERLVFENVQINMEYIQDNGTPYLWVNVRIHNHKNQYVLQVVSDGARYNRRNSFRVPISKTARCIMEKGGGDQVLVKDISLSGFSITDRKKKLKLTMGDRLSISFEDLEYKIELDGRLVRIEENEENGYIIYGFVICNVCNDLSAYVNTKQVQNRRRRQR